MIDLSKQAGIKVFLKEDGFLEFGEDILFQKPEPRLFSAAKSFFANPEANIANDLLYLMYRNVRHKDHDQLLIKNKLRYDLTVIFPGVIGNEYNKTVGHYHPIKKGTNISYPEIYEVLYGNATMILQKYNYLDKKIEAVYWIEAMIGDKIIIPCQENMAFGHTTINTTSDFLILANVQEGDFSSDYLQYLQKAGASYHLLNINNQPVFVKNPKYDTNIDLFKLVIKKNMPDSPLYLSIIENIETFRRYLTCSEKSFTMLSFDKNYSVIDH